MAGIETRFQNLGVIPTIMALIKDFGVTGQWVVDKDNLKGKYVHAGDLVLLIPAQTVYYNLLTNFEKSEFERDLMNIHKQK